MPWATSRASFATDRSRVIQAALSAWASPWSLRSVVRATSLAIAPRTRRPAASNGTTTMATKKTISLARSDTPNPYPRRRGLYCWSYRFPNAISLNRQGPDRGAKRVQLLPSHSISTAPYNRDVPTYEYVCQSCGTHVEVYQRFSDETLKECGVCGGPLRKVFHPAGILFKGSGFYVTDSRGGKKSAAASGGSDGGKEKSKEPAKKES